MPKFSEFTELDELTFNGANCLICGYDSTDATATSNWRMTGDDFAKWLIADNQYSVAIADLTDSTGGSAGATISDVGSSFNQATLNNNFASLTSKINAINTALATIGLTKKS